MHTGIGYGKTILFGEHFVVHGIPAIASGLSLFTTAEISDSKPGVNIEDRSRPHLGVKNINLETQPDEILSKLVKALLQKLNLDLQSLSINIDLKTTVPTNGGAGSSAALAVSITRALLSYLGKEGTDKEIAEISFEGEKVFHGTPSGIDNTVATYGGLLWFIRGNPNIIEPLKTKSKGFLVIGDTNITHNVKELVDNVRYLKTTYPEKFNPIFEQASKLVYSARENLFNSNWSEVGKLMTFNHELLKKIEVSIEELDFMVNLAIKNGALGAKLTGGGGGGCMIALVPNASIQKNISQKLIDAGFTTYLTQIG